MNSELALLLESLNTPVLDVVAALAFIFQAKLIFSKDRQYLLILPEMYFFAVNLILIHILLFDQDKFECYQ